MDVPPFDRGNSSPDPEKCQGLKLIYWRVKWNLVDVGCSNPKPLFWCERFQKLEHWEIMIGEHHSFHILEALHSTCIWKFHVKNHLVIVWNPCPWYSHIPSDDLNMKKCPFIYEWWSFTYVYIFKTCYFIGKPCLPCHRWILTAYIFKIVILHVSSAFPTPKITAPAPFAQVRARAFEARCSLQNLKVAGLIVDEPGAPSWDLQYIYIYIVILLLAIVDSDIPLFFAYYIILNHII